MSNRSSRRISTGSTSNRPENGGNGVSNESNADAIKVLCRFRPGRGTQRNDLNANTQTIDNFRLDEEYNEVLLLSEIADSKMFKFDRVFGTSTTQQQLFAEVQGTVDSVMAGFNGTIMAYGQTSAGKSFSMEGLSLRDSTHMGIVPRCVDKLFDEIERANEDDQFQVILSFYEIYCEKIRDLLNPQSVNLKLRESKGSGFVIQDVTEIYCTDRESILRVIEFGKANRAAAPTLMNAESSRSHSIVSILVDQKNTTSGRNKKGTLFLVDLAGSEKVSKTGASGVRLEEAKNINGSLTTLGMVINALCDNQSHIPYRDSKLTMILMDALGGNSKTTLIICCNPEHTHTPETLSTLRFGERAKRIKNHARVNEEYSAEELKAMLIAAKREIATLREREKERERELSETSAIIDTASQLALTTSETNPANALSATEDEEQRIAREKQQLEERERERARFRAKLRVLERERAACVAEKERCQSELASHKSRITSLEEELETEKMRWREEQEQRMDLSTECVALRATISEMEERLLQASLKQQALRVSASFYENNSESASQQCQSPVSALTNGPMSPAMHSHSFEAQEEALCTPETTTFREVPDSAEDESQNDISLQELQSRFESQIAALTFSINTHEIETKTAQASALSFAEKYQQLREQYDLHIQRLMQKLTHEQHARTALQETLEDTQHKLWRQQSTPGQQSAEKEHGGMTRSLWSWFSNASHTHASPSARSFARTTSQALDREQNTTRALELCQFRVTQLVAELEANKEAQSIVLETKECVMRSLARQNSQLTLERDQLNRRVEDLGAEKELLAGLVRGLQTHQPPLESQNSDAMQRRRVVKGGNFSREHAVRRDVSSADLASVEIDVDDAVGTVSERAERVRPTVSFIPVTSNERDEGDDDV